MIETTSKRLDVPFVFRDRPTSLPAELRPIWRMCLLLLILENCHGRKASLEQLHVMNWAIRSAEGRSCLIKFLAGSDSPENVVVKYDPSLSRAIDFALAEDLVSTEQGDDQKKAAKKYRLSMTGKGRELVEAIVKNHDTFSPEKKFLSQIGKVTQSRIQNLFA